MAHTVRACCVALIFVIMWLLVKAKIDVCKKGDVTVKPSHVISLGLAVNISCSLKPQHGCSRNSSFNSLILYKFDRKIKLQRGRSLSSQVSGLPLGTTLFVCKLTCSSEEIRICGAEVSVGVVPEQPQNLSCTQKGRHGNVTCTWDRGQDTHLYTVYTLQLNGPKNLICQKQCNDYHCDHVDLGINLTPESPESTYTAMVTAANSLGSASSFPSTFTFLDIVRPLPPWDIRIEFVHGAVSKCTLHWSDEGMVLLNQLRYRPDSSRSWNTVNTTNANGRHDLLDLKPFTEYEFQVSSKLHLHKGSWSDWSESLRTKTPEEEPTGTLDVWYMTQNIDYRRQRISLFWKNLSVSDARGKILYYQVTLLEKTGEKATLKNITEHTSWTWVIPRTENWAVAVAAANSKGTSLPTCINITNLCGAGWLAPGQVSANSEGEDSIMVTWEPPGKAVPAVQEYVLEWREILQRGSLQRPLNWLRMAPYSTSALISDNIQPYTCYAIRVHALSGDQGGCTSIQGSSKYKAPLSGPHINAITEEKGSTLISWDEIPAQEQMGCILHYRIYWKEQDLNSQPRFCGSFLSGEFIIMKQHFCSFTRAIGSTRMWQTHLRDECRSAACESDSGAQSLFWKFVDTARCTSEIPYRVSPNSHPLDSLQPKVRYILWMTALTAAGEGPQGNKREFCLQGKPNWSIFVIPSICTAIVVVSIFSKRYLRQKVFVLLSALRPQWCSRKIPDPANSTWAKKYAIVEMRKLRHRGLSNSPDVSQLEKMQLPLDRLLTDWPTLKEPEPLVISEVLHQVTPAFRHLIGPSWPEKGRVVPGHYTSEEDTGSSASSSPPPQALSAGTGQLVDLYKVLGSRGPDSKLGNPASPLTVLPVDYLPTQEGYLPSNMDDLPSHEAPVTEPLEELEPQHISLSIFPSSSLHSVTFSCGAEKLTLDRLKMGCGSLML